MTSKTNFLTETEDIIKHSKQTIKNIDWIGSSETAYYRLDWNEFKLLAEKLGYDNNTSKFQIAMDLVIVFKDGSWLSREHDGKWEHWQYHKVPIAKGKQKKIKSLLGKDQTLEVINNNVVQKK